MITQNKKVIYTALFGERGKLTEPAYLPKGWDFICFTDRDNVSSKNWKIIKKDSLFEGNPRKSAKIFKILPHRHLAEYERSLWIDANLLLRGDINDLVCEHKKDVFVAYSHAESKPDSRDCVYEELDALLAMNAKGRNRDNDKVMISQIDRYKEEGYPKENGLIVGMFLLRKHNDPLVKKTMEDWWQEIESNSIRDQLSFNYTAWKSGLGITYLKGDSRDNAYVSYSPHVRIGLSKRINKKIKDIRYKIFSYIFY